MKQAKTKGQLASVLLVIVWIFIAAISIFFMNHFNTQIFTEMDEYFNSTKDNDDTNFTYAHNATQRVLSIENSSTWDYAFLAIFIGLMLQMLIFSFASRVSPVFYWVFVIMAILFVVVGYVLSDIWIDISLQPEFSETIDRYPITNTILGSKFPMIVTGIILLGMIILFGKRPGPEGLG